MRTESKPPVIVTTSWDDGHHHDMKTAELLTKYGLKGTFYVSFNDPGKLEISEEEIRSLCEQGMEIGSHSLSHKLLTNLKGDALHSDLTRSRERLEEITRGPVRSLSYPQGVFNAEIYAATRKAGYQLARTTIEFRTGPRFDPLKMPVTFEFFHRSRFAIIRHALRDGNVLGISNWIRWTRSSTDPFCIAQRVFERVCRRGGIFHITARSWEIERDGLWNPLEEVFELIARREQIQYVTNFQAMELLNGATAA